MIPMGPDPFGINSFSKVFSAHVFIPQSSSLMNMPRYFMQGDSLIAYHNAGAVCLAGAYGRSVARYTLNVIGHYLRHVLNQRRIGIILS